MRSLELPIETKGAARKEVVEKCIVDDSWPGIESLGEC